jgi:hypothetical protein
MNEIWVWSIDGVMLAWENVAVPFCPPEIPRGLASD